MKLGVLVISWVLLTSVTTHASDFGLAESVLGEYGAIRYENTYTKVPTSGKLISIRIADNGTIYYICREKTGYVIYHLEIRPMKDFSEKVEQEIKEKSRNWAGRHPDELLLTQERVANEIKEKHKKYHEAVWVRNEIVIQGSRKEPEASSK
ncbi:MAG: hypothetical protein RDU20_00825 [Desulfomonilaceae bacterium]|nr:hypothetical protein [Desulfomonilaceae bacterium]